MKKSRKLEIYELHSKSYIISPTKIGKRGKFVQKKEGKTCSINIEPEELGKLVKEWMGKSIWSEGNKK